MQLTAIQTGIKVTSAKTYLLELADPENEPDPRLAAEDFPLYGTENPDNLVEFCKKYKRNVRVPIDIYQLSLPLIP